MFSQIRLIVRKEASKDSQVNTDPELQLEATQQKKT